jgi:hypothetical protein
MSDFGVVVTKEQARNNFRFLGDWAPEETAITRHVRRTSINLGSVIFGLQRRRLLIAVSEGHPQPQPDAPSPQAPLLVLKTGSYSQSDPKPQLQQGTSVPEAVLLDLTLYFTNVYVGLVSH